jgi:hypothetical protein
LLRLRGWWSFTPPARHYHERRALWLQERQYPGNWVMTVNAGDDHDFGVDYTECGILKFCREQGASELMAYLCPTDYFLSERMGLGLKRTTTLGEGYARCDFRFKKGAPTVWPAGLREKTAGA